MQNERDGWCCDKNVWLEQCTGRKDDINSPIYDML